MSESNIDFLAIGDIVNDDFIDLIEAQLHTGPDGVERLDMKFGDKLPYRDRELIYAVGNSPNAATSATRLGLSSAIMTHVGDDELGEKTIAALKERGVDTEFVTVETGQKTNYHFVLRFNAERTILIKHAPFKYDLKAQVAGKPIPRWAYFSSVGEDSMQYHRDIAEWVANNDIKLAFQPGSFQIKLGYEKLDFIYKNCELFFCNVEEAERILQPVVGKDIVKGKRHDAGDDRKKFVQYLISEMHNLGPKIVCITDGPGGAYASDGEAVWWMPMYPDPAPPVDRTGAGDSFSSTFTSVLAMGKGIDEALAWGPINSMSVVQYVGAQAGLLTRAKLEEYLENAPDFYKAEKLA
jgi:ribokinase